MTDPPKETIVTAIALPTPLIEARGVNRRLGRTTVLHDVDLSVADGEFLAVMGPSGCGKSTLLYTLSGLEDPTDGSVLWAGEDHSTLGERARSRRRLLEIGVVFQQFHLLRNLSLLDNVLLPGLLARTEPRTVLRARAEQLMTQLGVDQLADHGVGEASGGQLQRVALARALINRPRLLVADEPTGALDSAAGEEMMDALAGISADGTTIVLVTHDLEVAAHADRVTTMADGEITGELLLGRWNGGEEQGLAARAQQIREDSRRRSQAASA